MRKFLLLLLIVLVGFGLRVFRLGSQELRGDESLGRPVLYGTTRKFLQMFGLNSLKDLPEIEQLRPPT